MTDFATLGMDVDSRGLKKGQRALRDFEGQAERTEGRVGKASMLMSRALVGIGLAAAAAFSGANVVRGISNFEQSMSRVGAISRASARDLEAMRDVAKRLGSTTEFSATQAAEGLGFLSMAGFDARESVEALPQVLDLATASGMGLARSADIASNVISGFGLAASDAAEVADTLAAASSRSNTDVAQLGQAMSTVAPIAASLDMSLQDAAGAIGVLSDAGIQGARAGTAMRGVLASLAGPTDQARDAIESYGLAVEDVDPATNSLSDIMDRFSDVGLSAADAMTIFGREAASGALALVEASGRVRELSTELNGANGAAAAMAETMRDNLGGDLQSLRSALEGLVLSLGESGLTSVLRSAVQALTGAVRVMSDNVVPAFKTLATVIAGLVATQIPAMIAALGTYVVAATSAGAITGAFTAAVNLARLALVRLGGPLGLIYGLLGSVAAGLVLFGDKAKNDAAKGAKAFKDNQIALNAALGTFHETAAPAAAAEALNLATQNVQLAKSAREAAKAEIALAKAAMAGMRPGAQSALAREQIAAATERLASAEASLAEAYAAQKETATQITGGSFNLPGITINPDDIPTLPDPETPPGLGGAGGARDRMSILDQLLNGVGDMTPREKIEAWHEEVTAALNDANLKERGMLQKHNEYKLEIERLYQSQLRELQAQQQAQRLGEAADFFGSLQSLAQQGGEGAVKAAKVFGAAEALINTFIAQSQVLADPTLGFFGKLAAYAKIGAAGFGLVNAIKSSNPSSASTTGGTPGGAATSGGATQQAQPRIVLNVQPNERGDIPMETFTSTIETINDELNLGGRIVA